MWARKQRYGLTSSRSSARQVLAARVAGRARVVHLTSAHCADDPRIFGKECLSLARAGYLVTVVAPEENMSRRWLQAVEVIPVRRRGGRLGRMLASTVGVAVAALRCRAALYHFHDPELIPMGLLLRLLGKRVVYDAHEDLPRDILMKNWIPRYLRGPVSRAAAAAEWVAGHSLSGIVAATPTIGRRFPARHTVLVQNFAKLSEFSSAGRFPRERRQTVAYVGSVTLERCAAEMIEAVARVGRYPELRLVLAGEIESERLAGCLAAMEGWSRVDYRGFQPRPGVVRILSQAVAGLAVFHPVQSYIESQPVKMFEYMAAGLPVIAADFPRFREIVEGNHCGICVPPRDPGAIAAAIEWVLDHPEEAQEMGQRGRALAFDRFNWDGQEQALLRLYRRLLV